MPLWRFPISQDSRLLFLNKQWEIKHLKEPSCHQAKVTSQVIEYMYVMIFSNLNPAFFLFFLNNYNNKVMSEEGLFSGVSGKHLFLYHSWNPEVPVAV